MKIAGKFSTSFLFVLVLTFVISMGASYFFLKGKFSFDSSFIEDIESRQSGANKTERRQEPARLYENNRIDSAGDNARSAATLVAAEDAVRKYLQTFRVRLLDLYMDGRGMVYIDIGSELKKNFRGDASEEIGILAGLYKTIQTTVPEFTALKILIDGHEAASIGGHIDISRPLGKEIAENI